MEEQDLIEKFKYEIGDNCQHSSYCSKKSCQTNDGVVCFVDAQTVDQCVQIAKDYAEQEAIEFAEWIVRNCNHSRLRQLDYFELYKEFKNRENER